MKKNCKIIYTILFALFLLTACKQALLPEPAPAAQQSANSKYGTIVFAHNLPRTSMPDVTLSFDGFTVKLTSNGSHGERTGDFTVRGSASIIENIEPGSWNVSITATKNGVTVASGTLTDQAIAAGDVKTITVPLVFTKGSGTGNLALKIRFPKSSGVNYLETVLDGGTAVVQTITDDSDNTYSVATISQSNVAAGERTLKLSFKRGGAEGTQAGTFIEAINIWSGLTSDKWLNANGELKDCREFSVNEFANPDSLLSALSLSDADIAFEASTLTYLISGMAPSTAATLTATRGKPGQGIQYRINAASANAPWTDIPSGIGGQITLSPGSNKIEVLVTAPDRANKTTYILTRSYPKQEVQNTYIEGVVVPVRGGVPVSTIRETSQYTGTVSWSPSHNPFKGNTAYTATITLSAKTGWTFANAGENFFRVASTTSRTYVSKTDSTYIFTVTFPKTATQVGDIEYEGGTPIGVVFWVGSGGDAGKYKIVALKNAILSQYNSYMKWGVDSWLSDRSDTDGRINLISYSNAKYGDGYPSNIAANKNSHAMAACAYWDASSNSVGSMQGTWYLPSKNELDFVYEKRTEINNALNAINFFPIPDGVYWSSTIVDSTRAYIRQFSISGYDDYNERSVHSWYVRAIRAYNSALSLPLVPRLPLKQVVYTQTPQTSLESLEYTGTVNWSGELENGRFGLNKIYTASVELVAKEGYTFANMANNYFTAPGAGSVTLTANSGAVCTLQITYPSTKFEPGCIYFENNVPIGVVFWINNDNLNHFKILSLKNAGNLQWGINGEFAGNSVVEYLYYYKKLPGSDIAANKNSHAMAACAYWDPIEGAIGNSEGDWYLPSDDDIMILHNKKNEVCLALEDISGSDLLYPGPCYWTSSPYGNSAARCRKLEKINYAYYGQRSSTNTVRAVRDVTLNPLSITGSELPLPPAVYTQEPKTSIYYYSDASRKTEYSGYVTWNGELDNGRFALNRAYTATVTLFPSDGHSFTSLSNDFFTAPGASSVTITANTGKVCTVEVVYPATVFGPGVIQYENNQAIGVVFWVDENNSNKYKVVALKDAGEKIWGINGNIGENYDDGRTNLTNYKKLSGSNIAYNRNNHAMAACAFWDAGNNTVGTTEGAWYLPAINELKAIQQQSLKVNRGLTSASGNTLINLDCSSSTQVFNEQTSTLSMAYFDFSMGRIFGDSLTTKFAVRAIKAYGY